VGSAFEVPSKDSIANLGKRLCVEVSIDHFVGVDDDESRPDIGENLVLSVPLNQISQYFRLVKKVHLAHVGVELSFGHLEGVPEGSHHPETSLVGLGIVLHPLALEGPHRDAFEKRLTQLLLGRRQHPTRLLFMHNF